ncbi:MAG: ParB/RepB/Spo0J family partition protein [Candidatus Saccharimonadales bacterium]
MIGSSKLGKGLGSLIPEGLGDDNLDVVFGKSSDKKIEMINLDNIEPNKDQPRRSFDEQALEDLANSIKEHGIIQPLVIVKLKSDKYQIVAGERRYRAARLAGLDQVPALIRTLQKQQIIEVALIENVQREDLNPLEAAASFLALKDQFKLKAEDIGKKIGKSPQAIINIMRLMNLPDYAKEALLANKIKEGHARAVLSLKDYPNEQRTLLARCVDDGWSVRQAEEYSVRVKLGESEKAEPAKLKYLKAHKDFISNISTRLNMPVQIKPRAKGGNIVISFSDDDDLKKIQNFFN